MAKREDAREHANRITANARMIIDAMQPTKRNGCRPNLANILDATNKLLAMATAKNDPPADKPDDQKKPPKERNSA